MDFLIIEWNTWEVFDENRKKEEEGLEPNPPDEKKWVKKFNSLNELLDFIKNNGACASLHKFSSDDKWVLMIDKVH